MLSGFGNERINVAMTGFCWQLMGFAVARFFGYLIKFLWCGAGGWGGAVHGLCVVMFSNIPAVFNKNSVYQS
jgi:carbon starvation protein CstA